MRVPAPKILTLALTLGTVSCSDPALLLTIDARADVGALDAVRIVVEREGAIVADQQFPLAGKALPQTVTVVSRGKGQGAVVVRVQGLWAGKAEASAAVETTLEARTAAATLERLCSGVDRCACELSACGTYACGLGADGCGSIRDCGGCGAGESCAQDAGLTGTCLAPCGDGFCREGEICWEGRCATAACAGVICPADARCVDGACYPQSCVGVVCPPAEVCAKGFCESARCVGVICPTDQTCADGLCYPKQCGTAACLPYEACLSGSCRDVSCVAVSCPNGKVCANGFCVSAVCNGVTCPAGKACGPAGLCVDVPCVGVSCAVGACDQGFCRENRPNGTGCQNAVQCASSSCVDAVCCADNCAGQCAACNLPGATGTCAPIAAGADPANECGNYFCAGGNACAQSCTSDSSCKAGAYCDTNNQCVARRGNGTSCSSANTCASGFCVDTVCCDGACGGVCQSCGSSGACGPSPARTDAANECGRYFCSGGAGCATSCADNTDCKTGFACFTGVCVPLKPNGSSCMTATECGSGICAYGGCGGFVQIHQMPVGGNFTAFADLDLVEPFIYALEEDRLLRFEKDGGGVTALYTPTGAPYFTDMEIDRTTMEAYLTADPFGTTRRVPLDGGAAVVYSPSTIGDRLALHGSDLFVASGRFNEIYKAAPRTGSAIALYIADGGDPVGLAAGAGRLYWANYDRRAVVEAATTSPGPLIERFVDPSPSCRPWKMALDATALFFASNCTTANSSAIYRMPVGTGTATPLVTAIPWVTALHLDGATLYFGGEDGTLWRMPANGSAAPTKLYAIGAPDYIVTDGTFVFWGEISTGAIYRGGK